MRWHRLLACESLRLNQIQINKDPEPAPLQLVLVGDAHPTIEFEEQVSILFRAYNITNNQQPTTNNK